MVLLSIADSARALHRSVRTLQAWTHDGSLALHGGLVDQAEAEHVADLKRIRWGARHAGYAELSRCLTRIRQNAIGSALRGDGCGDSQEPIS